jgi:ABC-type amino acid transport substrate-binding protein
MKIRRLLAAASFMAFVAPPARAAGDLPGIETRGTLRILVPADETPEMFAFERGTSPGFEREMLEGFAALRKVKIEVIPIERFEDILPALQRGQGDIVTGINDTAARRQAVDFTVEVLPSRHVAVTRKPHPAVDTVFQFRAEKVGVLKGTTWADTAVAAGVRPELFAEEKDVLAALKSGRITATVLSGTEFILVQRHDSDLQAGVALGSPGSAAWAVRKEDHQLKSALDAYLTGLRHTGSWSRLVVKYFGRDALDVLGKRD